MSTVRPSEQAADLAHRMHDAGKNRGAVTRSGGPLVGLLLAADVDQQA